MTSPHRSNSEDSPQNQWIDQVLAALNHTETPAALEEHILQRLARQESASSRSSWLTMTKPAPAWRFATAGAAAVLLATALLMLHHPGPHGEHATVTPAASAANASSTAPQRVTPFEASAMSSANPVASRLFSPCADARPFNRRPRPCGRSGETPVLRTSEGPLAQGTATELAKATTSIAVDPAFLPSLAAPAQAPTPQERLLVTVLRSQGIMQLAQLGDQSGPGPAFRLPRQERALFAGFTTRPAEPRPAEPSASEPSTLSPDQQSADPEPPPETLPPEP